MEKIYSNVEPDVLLAIIARFKDCYMPRNEIVPPEELLQGALIRVSKGDRFRPHKHNEKEVNYGKAITSECWIVFRGCIEAIIYDLDDKIAIMRILGEGDACFSFRGGHTFETLEDGTCVWEIKTGPYEGQAKDKTFIE